MLVLNLATVPPLLSSASVSCDSNANFQYFHDECLNSTHVKTTSGSCKNGAKQEDNWIESCAVWSDSSDDEYCHECGAKMVCAAVEDKSLVCEGALSGTCDPNGSGTAYHYPCADKKNWFVFEETCRDGVYSQTKTKENCEAEYPGFPYCLNCAGVELCSEKDSSCADLRLSSTGSRKRAVSLSLFVPVALAVSAVLFS